MVTWPDSGLCTLLPASTLFFTGRTFTLSRSLVPMHLGKLASPRPRGQSFTGSQAIALICRLDTTQSMGRAELDTTERFFHFSRLAVLTKEAQ